MGKGTREVGNKSGDLKPWTVLYGMTPRNHLVVGKMTPLWLQQAWFQVDILFSYIQYSLPCTHPECGSPGFSENPLTAHHVISTLGDKISLF